MAPAYNATCLQWRVLSRKYFHFEPNFFEYGSSPLIVAKLATINRFHLTPNADTYAKYRVVKKTYQLVRESLAVAGVADVESLAVIQSLVQPRAHVPVKR